MLHSGSYKSIARCHHEFFGTTVLTADYLLIRAAQLTAPSPFSEPDPDSDPKSLSEVERYCRSHVGQGIVTSPMGILMLGFCLPFDRKKL